MLLNITVRTLSYVHCHTRSELEEQEGFRWLTPPSFNRDPEEFAALDLDFYAGVFSELRRRAMFSVEAPSGATPLGVGVCRFRSLREERARRQTPLRRG